MPHLTFSADDFGLTRSVNEAVELAHLEGALTQASLMVAAPEAADAIARAKRLPDLKMGLHLVLVDGDSRLGHTFLPNITAPDGRFPRDQLILALRYAFLPKARAQLRAEIRAQFEAFAATGLALHHADAHKHMHLHPIVGALMIEIGREFGLLRIRIPAEPPSVIAASGENTRFADHALYAWTRLLRFQARGLMMNDYLLGLKHSGHMTPVQVEKLLAYLPEGKGEMYFHPATARDETLKQLMPDYEHVAEFEALLAIKQKRIF